jgi:hypothetical protein
LTYNTIVNSLALKMADKFEDSGTDFNILLLDCLNARQQLLDKTLDENWIEEQEIFPGCFTVCLVQQHLPLFQLLFEFSVGVHQLRIFGLVGVRWLRILHLEGLELFFGQALALLGLVEELSQLFSSLRSFFGGGNGRLGASAMTILLSNS